MIEEAAKKVLYPPAEVKMWFNHFASVSNHSKECMEKGSTNSQTEGKGKIGYITVQLWCLSLCVQRVHIEGGELDLL